MTAQTLTKAKLLEKTNVEFRWVEIPEFGKVGIRSVPESTRMLRVAQANKAGANGVDQRYRVNMLIDQLMVDEKTPMFTSDDVETLLAQSGPKLDPLIVAIHEFNGELEKNEQGGTNGSGS